MIIPRHPFPFCLLLSLPFSSAAGAEFSGAAHESFSYPVGDFVNTASGGTGWNVEGAADQANTTIWGNSPAGATFFNPGATAANQSIVAESLSHPAAGFPASSGGAVLISGAGQIGRAFGQEIDSGTLYFSYLTRKTSNSVRSLNFSLFGSNERLAFGQLANNLNTRDQDGTWLFGDAANSGSFALLVSNSQNSPVASPADPASFNGLYLAPAQQAYAVDTTFLNIVKIEFNFAGGVEDRITWYLNPADVADESGLAPYLVIDHLDVGLISGFRMFAGGSQTAGTETLSPSSALFDEIRFGATFASVTTAVAQPPGETEWDEWVGLHFSAEERENTVISSAGADADLDGRSNFLEFALGTDPRSGSGEGLVTRTTSGGFALDYPAPRTSVVYEVEASVDLVRWETAGVTDAPAAGDPTGHLRTATVIRDAGGTGFLRLRVTPKE